jgi:hypothetical protein
MKNMKMKSLLSAAVVTLALGSSSSALLASETVIIDVPTNVSAPLGLAFSEVYSIVSLSSKLCLDVVDKGTANGVRFQQWGCNAAANQKYLLAPIRAGVYKLVTVGASKLSSTGSKVISVKDSDQADGAVVQLWQELDVDNQELAIEPVAGGSYVIKFKHSNKCLDVSNASVNSGARLQQWTCTGSDNQKFNFARMESI